MSRPKRTAFSNNDVLRRDSVSLQAELSVEATTASMVIRAVRRNPGVRPADGPLEAVASILARIEQLARYREQGLIGDIVDDDVDMVTRASFDLLVVMARAVGEADTTVDPPQAQFPVLDSLMRLQGSITVDTDHRTLVVQDPDEAEELAEALYQLGGKLLTGVAVRW
jgi:hypothetical protein